MRIILPCSISVVLFTWEGFTQGQSSCVNSPHVLYRWYSTWEGFTQGQSSCVKSPHVLYRLCSLHGKVLLKVKVLAKNRPMYSTNMFHCLIIFFS